MKKFKFKFASVLHVRKIREEDALRELGLKQRKYQAEIENKARLMAELRDALQRRERLGAEAVEISAFHIEQKFIDGTKARIIRADQAIFRASKAVEKALRAYLTAKRQTRVIETLYDKEYAQFRRDMARIEQKKLDDLMVMRSRYVPENSEDGL